MATNQYWTEKFQAATGTYQCPWCNRDLRSKISQSAANPGKQFVSCDKKFGGCGMFCFTDALPNEKFNPNKGGVKRERSEEPQPRPGGNNIVGPIVSAPNVTEVRLAELAAKVDGLASVLREIQQYIKEVNDQ